MLWCVKTLSFKDPMYVGSMLWRVRTLSFQSSPVCRPRAAVCGDFEIFHKVPLCVVAVLWCVRTWSFQSSPSCVGSVLFGSVCILEEVDGSWKYTGAAALTDVII